MKTTFEHMEVVKVVGDFVTVRKQRHLKEEIGIIVGWNELDADGVRLYAVHFNKFGEVIGVPENQLESLSRFAVATEIVTRSRFHKAQKRTSGG